MPILASPAQAGVNRRRGSASDGATFWHTLYIGTSRYNMAPGEADPDPAALFPMAFLVEQDPTTIVTSHYHRQDQFQLVVDGAGTLGLHDIAGPSVHFTGAYTAYGPIKPKSDKGIWYFTLRNGFDPGARFMAQPENRAALRTVPGRKHREAVAGPLTDADVGELFTEADGLGAWHHRLTAGEAITGPAPDTGRGQYWVVIDGTLEAGGTALPRLSCVFVRPDEPAFTAKAGPDGLDVIAMQFPRHH